MIVMAGVPAGLGRVNDLLLLLISPVITQPRLQYDLLASFVLGL